MQIDRSRFLFLTTAIAAANSACNPSESQPPAVAIASDSPDASAQPAPTSEATATPHPASEGGAVATASVTATPPPPPPGCPDSDNMIGTPASCSGLRAPGPQCESFVDTKADCSRFAKGFKPKVAQRAVACFLSKSGTKEVCDFTLSQKCAVEAVQEACIDPAVGTQCDSIMANCGGRRGRAGLTRIDCMHALSGLTGTNRSKVAACISESCGIPLCFYDLK
ncbi:hypothetical protein BH09MYX1_BH09MYX1_41120 [soil metagenome]